MSRDPEHHRVILIHDSDSPEPDVKSSEYEHYFGPSRTSSSSTITNTRQKKQLRPTESLIVSEPKRRKKNLETTTRKPVTVNPTSGHAMVQAGAIAAAVTTSKQARPQSCDDADGHYIIQAGKCIGDDSRYKLLEQIGQGTFGKVAKALDTHTNTHVAVKIIRAVPKYQEAAKAELRVLKDLARRDPKNTKRCIHLRDHFTFKDHTCMVFDLLDKAVFDFLKDNNYNPFPISHIQHFARQLINAVDFLHDELKVIHTDLKPENLMLVSSGFEVRFDSKRTPSKGRRILKNTEMRLIDFGSATYDEDYHSSVVSTRHYRAPEIILGMGWSYPCDMWSVGCILIELWTGDALFQTHDNLEHLKMMEIILGKIPLSMYVRASPNGRKFFKGENVLDYPNADTTKSSKRFLEGLKKLEDLVKPTDEIGRQFLDLLRGLLAYDPQHRLTAKQALQHPFVCNSEKRF